MLTNYHLHTSFSPDSKTPPEIMLAAAEQAGLSEICFTDHVEYFVAAHTDFVPDPAGYAPKLRSLCSNRLRIRVGAEAGMTGNSREMSSLCRLLDAADLDFTIASLHFVNAYSPYMPEFYAGQDQKHIFSTYLQRLFSCLLGFDADHWDCVGHIDFMTKGVHGWTDPRMHYRDAADELDMLFRYLIDRGKCIEYNTASYKDIPHLPLPGGDWLKRWTELGGEYITFGTDAHSPDLIDYRLREAIELARQSGIRYYATFSHHQPILHRL